MPKFSPDGKKLLLLKSAPKPFYRRNHSYSDGDFGFNWSDDSKWLL
jgi:hypothetical protein